MYSFASALKGPTYSCINRSYILKLASIEFWIGFYALQLVLFKNSKLNESSKRVE